MAKKKVITDVDVKGKKVLMRVDFNVPLDDNQNVTDDARIQAALPSIKAVIDRGGRLMLMSHLGRPKGKPNPEFSLSPAAKQLGVLLGKDVKMAPDCVGDEVKKMADALQDGDVMVLENLRFHAQEEDNDPQFSQQLADLADLYVNDAFGTAHRKHASMYGVPEKLGPGKRVCGLLIEKELQYLGDALDNPTRPFVAILGGAKVSDKIGVIKNLLNKVDTILIGGAMTYTFKKAAGIAIGNSLVEDDKLDVANELTKEAESSSSELLLPEDTVAAQEFKANVPTKVVEGEIPDGWEGLDIGPKTTAKYSDIIASAKTVVWNGPVGVFEMTPFDAGTRAVAEAVAKATHNGATTVIGGGDSAAAIKQFGLESRVTHISTGGGASLKFLEGKAFDPIEILDDA